MTALGDAIRGAEEALLRCNSTKPKVLRVALTALLAAAREAESALASERERADKAETIARECKEQYHARRDALIAAEDRAVKAESALRAATAQPAPLLCTKCRRVVDTPVHEGCNYLAAPIPQPAPLEEAAERVRGLLWGWTNYKVDDSEFKWAVEDLLSALDSARGGGGA